MEILLIMVAGVVLGATVFPETLKGLNEKLTLCTTALLIFSMGALLGGRDAFVEELSTVGVASFLFAIIPAVFSTILVYALTQFFMSDVVKRQPGSKTKAAQENSQQEDSGAGSEVAMIAIAVVALLLGVFYGLSNLVFYPVDWISENSHFVLYVLLFLVGITVGGSRGLLGKLKQYRARVFIIPFGIVVGSVAGGLLCAPLVGMSFPTGGAIASGLGWYSLSGIMMTEIAGAQVGSITFMSNLLREILSFFAIPFIARFLNYPTCLAPAAATSEDTTLPMLIRCTNGETVVLAVLSGVICSACVPVLIELFRPFI